MLDDEGYERLTSVLNNDTTSESGTPVGTRIDEGSQSMTQAAEIELIDIDDYEPTEPPEYLTGVEAIGEVEKPEQSAHVGKQSEQTQGQEQNDQFSKLDSLRRQFDYTRAFKKTEYIGGLFARGAVSVLAGSAGVGKSTLLQKCIHDICGSVVDADDQYRTVFPDGEGNYFALEPRARKVILLTGELGEDSLLERSNEYTWHTKSENFEVIDLLSVEGEGINLNINESEGLANFEHLAQTQGLDLIVLDSLGMFHTLKESDNDGLRVLFKNLAGLARRYNIAIGIVHHNRKRLSSEQLKPLTLDDIIGGSAISRYVHRVIVIEYSKDREMNTVTCLKSWGKWFKPFGYKKVDETWGHSRLEFSYDSIDIPQKTTTPTKSPASEAETLREKITLALRARKNEPIKLQSLMELLEIKKEGESNFKMVLGRMKDTGAIVSYKRGFYELPEGSAKITTDAEDDTDETLELDLEE